MSSRRWLAFAITAGAIVMASPLQAQQQRGPGGRGMGAGMGPNLDEQMELLTERLELTDEQAVSVRGILEAQAEKRSEAMQAMRGQGDRETMRSTMMALEEETSELLSEVLSEDQMKTYREVLEEMRPRRGPPIR